jgi:hypothetical protein
MASMVATLAAATLLSSRGIATADPCIEDAAGFPLNCTASDVQPTVLAIDTVIESCEFAGDTTTVNATLHFDTNPNARFDLGFYIGQDGMQALTGFCNVSIIPPSQTDLDGDMCGDAAVGSSQITVNNLTLRCVDSDNDGFLDFPLCISWDISSADVCNGPADATPDTAAKCGCFVVPTNLNLNLSCQNVTACSDGDGCCPAGCGAETDSDCPACFARPAHLTNLVLQLKRRAEPGKQKAIVKGTLDACDVVGTYSPTTDGIRFALSDASGTCFADELTGADCIEKNGSFRCKPLDRHHTGIRVVKLKAQSTCLFDMVLKVTRSDLSCMDAMQSPWVPSVASGSSCADVGCPSVETDSPTCPGTCGNGVTDPGEQCDGPGNDACPQECDPTCTCR